MKKLINKTILFFFIGFLAISLPTNTFGERCDVIIIQRSFNSDDIIENFDIQNSSHSLRLTYYEKHLKDLNNSDMIILLPTENKNEERKQIMQHYNINEIVPSNEDFEGIGTPEDIFQYLSYKSERKGSATAYYYNIDSVETINQWKQYWTSISEDTEYVDRIYAILQNIIPTSYSNTIILERSTCLPNNKDLNSGNENTPFSSQELENEIIKIKNMPSESEAQVLFQVYLILTIISSSCAIGLIVLYKKRKIF